MKTIKLAALYAAIIIFIMIILGVAPKASNAQGFIVDWSNPEVLFSFPEDQKSNQLWVLKNQEDTVYLWWPITNVEGEGEAADNSKSRTLHTQMINGEWRSPMDVMMWPDAGRLTSVVIDPEGILHGFSGTDCVSYVNAQHDEAMSARAWQERICLDQTGLANPAVGRAPDGTIYVLYAALENHSLRLIHSKDGGETWSSYITVEENLENFVRYPAMAVDDQGRIHAVWSISQAPDGYPPLGIYYSRSNNGGLNWTAPVQLGGMDEGEPAIAVYNDDVHVLWNGDADKRGRYYRHSKDAGETWEAVEILSPPSSQGGRGGLQRPPAIIVDNLGNVHALLHEQESLFYTAKIDQAWIEKQPLYIPGMMRAAEIFSVRLVITGGNQLHAIYLLASFNQLNTQDITNRSWTLFHQSREIDADPVAPVPWPERTNEEVSTISQVEENSPSNEVSHPDVIDFSDSESGNQSDFSQSNPSSPFLWGSFAAVFFLGFVILVYSISGMRFNR